MVYSSQIKHDLYFLTRKKYDDVSREFQESGLKTADEVIFGEGKFTMSFNPNDSESGWYHTFGPLIKLVDVSKASNNLRNGKGCDLICSVCDNIGITRPVSIFTLKTDALDYLLQLESSKTIEAILSADPYVGIDFNHDRYMNNSQIKKMFSPKKEHILETV